MQNGLSSCFKNVSLSTLLALSLLFCALPSKATVLLVLEKPSGTVEKRINERLKDSEAVTTAIGFLNSTFKTPRDITLRFGPYERIWYENDEIQIPYGFIHDIRRRYQKAYLKHPKIEIDRFTAHVLLHVIFHEFAHALIEQYDMPVIGKEEDAADNFADVALINFFDEGKSIVTDAADLFYINSIGFSRPEKEDYWSEHSLAKQRYYARLCHVFGSSPNTQLELKKRIKLSDERAHRCVIQYYELQRSWMRLLEPALVNPPSKSSEEHTQQTNNHQPLANAEQ
ncbi:MAG: DUF4344 domain-containing metallopeptidase [Cellvibrionaceae bacterium]